MGAVPPHPGTVVSAAITTSGKTYGAALTVQTSASDNPTYQRDAAAILTGFRVLRPALGEAMAGLLAGCDADRSCRPLATVVAWSGDIT
jgi:hypothetical protein